MTRIRGKKEFFDRPEGIGEDAVLTVFRVPPEVAGQRVDVFLQGQLKRTSRTRTKVILRASAYSEEGTRLRPGSRVRAEQKILLWRAAWDETPVRTDVPVLYEDEHLLAVNKPPNLPVHPSARYHKNTLIKVLERERPDAPFLSLGHRLDRETSGVLLVSKSAVCDRALKKLLEARSLDAGSDDDDRPFKKPKPIIEKTYLAFTFGVPSDGSGARDFRLERNLRLDPHHKTRVKMMVSDAPDSLYASTVFHIEAERKLPNASIVSRVRCDLETGRQHQIRVHLASIGAPVVGDKLYGADDSLFAKGVDGELTDDEWRSLELPRHALHAARIALPHPMNPSERLAIVAPLPLDLSDFWETLAPF